MNQAYTMSIVLMLCLTTVSTGSLDEPVVTKINDYPSGFDGHENQAQILMRFPEKFCPPVQACVREQ